MSVRSKRQSPPSARRHSSLERSEIMFRERRIVAVRGANGPFAERTATICVILSERSLKAGHDRLRAPQDSGMMGWSIRAGRGRLLGRSG